MNESTLVDILKQASECYYNTGELYVHPKLGVITDEVYDGLYDELCISYPKSSYLKTVGISTRDAVRLPHYMPSQNKVYPVGLQNITCITTDNIVLSAKLDGVSCGLLYVNGKLKQAFTRGDGQKGRDITKLVVHLNVPKTITSKDKHWVRGEIIMRKTVFAKNWSEKYSNARNLVSGVINSLNSLHEATTDCEFIAYDWHTSNVVKREQLIQLREEGFDVVHYRHCKKDSMSFVSPYLGHLRKQYAYEVDGVILSSEVCEVPNAEYDRARYSIAYKENVSVTAKVIGVEWAISKLGRLKPRVQIESTNLSGVTIDFASGHNAKYIVDNKIGKGSIIQLTRSGEVIPYIVSVVKPTRAVLPKEDFIWEGVDIVVKNSEEQDIRKAEFFFANLGIENLGIGTLRAIALAGYSVHPLDIIKMGVTDWMSLDKFGERKANNILKEWSKLKNCYLPAFAHASGVFMEGFGTRLLETLYSKYGHMYLIKAGLYDKDKLYEDALECEGFSEIRAKQFARHAKAFREYLLPFKGYVSFKDYTKEKIGSKYAHIKVCFTGVRDAELVELICAEGAEVVSVSKATHVIVKDKAFESATTRTAKAKGIKTYTLQQFRELL